VRQRFVFGGQRGGGHIVVTGAAQEKALGPEWVDNKAPQLDLSPVPVPEKRRGRPAKEEQSAE
jgi:hypothetical protein